MKRCVICEAVLKGQQTRYCSRLCTQRAFTAASIADGRRKEWRIKGQVREKELYELSKEARDCASCGETFMVERKAKSRHCSSKCGSLKSCPLPKDHPVMIGIAAKRMAERTARIEARAEELEANRYRPTWVAGQCKRCGTSFVAEWVTSPDLTRQPQYCSTQCARTDAKDRRRAVKKNAFVSNVYRFQIFERDNWICQLCMKPIDREAKAPHPMSVSLDHILALANGGTHEPSNTQCAHFICNSLKGDRLAA